MCIYSFSEFAKGDLMNFVNVSPGQSFLARSILIVALAIGSFCSLQDVALAQGTEHDASVTVLTSGDFFTPTSESTSANFGKQSAQHIALKVQPGTYATLMSASHLQLEAFPLPFGNSADLDVLEFSVFTEKTVVYAVTENGQVERPLPNIRLYRGKIKGDPHSFVYLAVEPDGMSGTITRHGESYNIRSSTDPSLNIKGGTLNVFEATEEQHNFTCEVDDAFQQGPMIQAPNSEITSLEGLDTLEAVVALEADYESFLHYGGETETENYIIARMGESSAIYEKDVAIILSIGQLRVWTTEDPYPAKSANEGLNVFTKYWKENMSHVERTIAIYISRKPISANGVSQGLAWVGRVISDGNYGGVLCSESLGYNFVKFSGNDNFISGHVGVLAHEIGHNFGSPHTQSCYWRPAIDSCYNAESIRGQSPCFSSSQKHLILGGGELMSYCHLGGYGKNSKHNEIREKCGLHIRKRADAALCMKVVTGGGGGTGIEPSLTLLAPVGGEDICAGQPLDITWDAVGNNEINVYLSRDDGATFDSLIIARVPRNETGTTWFIPNDFPIGTNYRIRIKDGKNAELVDEIDESFSVLLGTVVTRFAPVLGIRYVCEGEGANFNLDAIGSGTLSYQWFRDGQPIAGQTTSNLQLEDLTAANDNFAEFWCVVTGDCGSTNSDTALLRVFSTPIIAQKPTNDTVCIGETARFDILVEGPNLVYKWRHLISGKTYENNLPYLIIPNITVAEAGGYQCEIQSSCGPVSTAGFFVILAQEGVKFVQPFWNDVIGSGDTFEVIWDENCLGNLKLEYSSNNGSDWTTINPSTPASNESWMWTVPSETTEEAVLKLTDLNNPAMTGESGTFAIRDLPRIEIDPPEFGFNLVAVGSMGNASVSITNPGNGELAITNTQVQGTDKVSILNGAGAGSTVKVAAGDTYVLNLEYSPTDLELMEGELLIDHDAADTVTVVMFRGESYVATSAPDIPSAERLQLFQNYPNPVSLSSGIAPAISFNLPASMHVTLAVYNSLGQEVGRLVDDYKSPGQYTLSFDIRSIPAGTYMYKLVAGQEVRTNIMQVVQ
jgi:metallopeptidase family M12-like protein